MATMNVSVPDPMKDWVEAQISSGQYASSSDYIRDLIRKDQARQEKIRMMQAAITQGIESGVAENFSMDILQKELDQELGEE